MVICNSLIVSTDLQLAMPDDEVYDGGRLYEGGYVILSRQHAQAVVDEAEDIGWNAINMEYSFNCDALVRARKALSRYPRIRFDVNEEDDFCFGLVPIRRASFWYEEMANAYIKEHQAEHKGKLYIGYRKVYD